MELIKNISKVDGFKPSGDDRTWGSYEGFEVETDQQRIYVLVDDQSSCCESWGSVSTPDDPKDFIGAFLCKVEVVDTALNKTEWDKAHPYGLDGGEAIFVNFETDHGTFQLAVYNSHNGYYGHDARVISRDVNVSTTL